MELDHERGRYLAVTDGDQSFLVNSVARDPDRGHGDLLERGLRISPGSLLGHLAIFCRAYRARDSLDHRLVHRPGHQRTDVLGEPPLVVQLLAHLRIWMIAAESLRDPRNMLLLGGLLLGGLGHLPQRTARRQAARAQRPIRTRQPPGTKIAPRAPTDQPAGFHVCCWDGGIRHEPPIHT